MVAGTGPIVRKVRGPGWMGHPLLAGTPNLGIFFRRSPVQNREFFLGEFPRSLDDRFRLSIPQELLDPFLAGGSETILAKERPGALSLWNAAVWHDRLSAGVELIKAKMQSGKLDGRLEEVQLLSRLLSTRHRPVTLEGRGRLLIPEGFREFLGVEPSGEVIVLGAGVCLEIWNPRQWIKIISKGDMPEFQQLFDKLSS